MGSGSSDLNQLANWGFEVVKGWRRSCYSLFGSNHVTIVNNFLLQSSYSGSYCVMGHWFFGHGMILRGLHKISLLAYMILLAGGLICCSWKVLLLHLKLSCWCVLGHILCMPIQLGHWLLKIVLDPPKPVPPPPTKKNKFGCLSPLMHPHWYGGNHLLHRFFYGFPRFSLNIELCFNSL